MNTTNLQRIQGYAQNLDTPYFGSDKGWVYQNYPWGELAKLPAGFMTTWGKLDVLTKVIPPGSSVVDLGCANGAVALGLALKDYRVTGIDSNPTHIAIAKLATAQLIDEGLFKGHDTPHWLTGTEPLDCDAMVSLSVWKWIAREAQDEWLTSLYEHARWGLLIELGVADSGMDMGMDLTRAAAPTYLQGVLGCKPTLAGTVHDLRHHMERDIWLCLK